MATIVTRSGKGSALTHDEVDANFTNLNTDKIETNAEVRAAVEAASDSNVFTDADHTKLNAIEASADVTDTANVVAALTAGSNITIAADGTIAGAAQYTHPTHDGDDAAIDTGALSGATVISDLDLNITTDTLGHVTDANATVSTRNLTLADLGYTGETNATADQTAAQLLTAIKTVDGAGSGLNADVLDGLSEATFMRKSANSSLDMNNNNIIDVEDIYLQDKIYHDGDTNTYIQFHASDQFRVVTGGSERFEINNSRTQIDNLLVTGTTTLSGTVTGAVSTTTGGVGTYAWLGGSSTSIRPNPGNSISGSSLRYAGTASTSTYSDNTAARIGKSSPSTPSGTWKAMGGTGSVARYNTTLFIRIS